MEQDRPEWAKGSIWEGWEWEHHHMLRWVNGYPVQIYKCAYKDADQYSINVTSFAYPSPQSALNVANAIAAEMGGWA